MNEFAHDKAPLDAELLKALDVCRPNTGDVESFLSGEPRERLAADPRYAAWQARSAAFDAAVGGAFAEVPLPLGMSVRLAAALAEAAEHEPAFAEDPAGATAIEPAPPVSRRRWLAAAGTALTATAAGTAFWFWQERFGRKELPLEQVLDELAGYHHRSAADAARAVPTSQTPAPAEFPLGRFVVPQAVPRWRPLGEKILGRDGIAYELAPREAPRAVLYLLADRLTAPWLAAMNNEPTRRPGTTGGCARSTWHEDNRVAVLIVEGDEARYGSFLERPPVFA